MRLVLGLLLLASSAGATDLTVHHQGRGFDTFGAPLTGTHTVHVSLYDAQTGGNLVFQDSFPNIAFSDGYFAVALGSGALTDTAVAAPVALWAETSFDLDPAMDRQRVGDTARAGHAAHATVPGTITTFFTSDYSSGAANLSSYTPTGHAIVLTEPGTYLVQYQAYTFRSAGTRGDQSRAALFGSCDPGCTTVAGNPASRGLAGQLNNTSQASGNITLTDLYVLDETAVPQRIEVKVNDAYGGSIQLFNGVMFTIKLD